MTIAILILVLVNTAVIAYLVSVIFEIRDGVQSYYPSLVKIMAEQRDVIQGTLDSINRWSDLCEDIIDHIERVEDMEGDIKDIFEWIHSIDDNIAGMRMDIQETDTKLGDLMAVHDLDILKIKKKISEIKEYLGLEDEEEYDQNHITVDTATNGDTDGDIPTNTVRENDKDVYALYEELVDRAKKKYETILKEKDHEGEDNA